MRKLSDKIKKDAMAMNACPEIVDNWSRMGMVEKYHEGAKWCMEREFPSYEVMAKFDKEAVAYGIYNQKTASLIAEKEQYVFNGSKIDLVVDSYKVCRVFIGRGTELNITVKDNAVAIVSNYGGTVNKTIADKGRCIIWDKELEI